ncbi:hypothetical protein HFN80_16970 [Rhizobium laguerreae]|uniref:META domain-containing protein n=1 Tax=Rhizobium laguerreae TaxID=1076926 RepID=UPI001C905A85|nr:META domain-containing protein [Rhizobium laguerreae]MBY3465685.1 hypothetical protein [Rhizobium laguerreae]
MLKRLRDKDIPVSPNEKDAGYDNGDEKLCLSTAGGGGRSSGIVTRGDFTVSRNCAFLYHLFMNDHRLIGLLFFLVALPTHSVSADDPPADPAQLEGRWTLATTDGRQRSGPPIYFEINGRRISGFDGCNNFGGSLDRPAMIRKGERDCPGLAPFPLGLENPLRQLGQARVEDDVMTLPMLSGEGTAVFRRD